jgi:AraC-like DNA-binding protein
MKVIRDPLSFLSGFYYEEPMSGLPALTHCGEALCIPGHHLRRHRHTGFEFLYLARGGIDWSVPGLTFSQGEGDLSAFYPQEWHSTTHPARNETHQLWIGLDLDRFGLKGRRFARLLRKRNARMLRGCHAIEPVLRAIVRQIITPLPGQKAAMLGYLHLLIVLIEQSLRLESEPPGYTTLPYSYGVQKAIAYMERRLDRRVPLIELSSVATVRQASHFCARFRQEVGITPAAYHFNLRMAAARDGLLQPDVSITEVALRFGFSSSQHFSSAFRRAFGTMPRLWRSLNRLASRN